MSSHLGVLASVRIKEICRSYLSSHPDVRLVEGKIAIGDWIVYLLPGHEVPVKQDIEQKFESTWSLPAKVTAVHDLVVDVECWATRAVVQVPLSKVRLLCGLVPQSLKEVNLRQLNHWLPPRLRTSQLHTIDYAQPWSEFLQEAMPEALDLKVESLRKRSRLL